MHGQTQLESVFCLILDVPFGVDIHVFQHVLILFMQFSMSLLNYRLQNLQLKWEFQFDFNQIFISAVLAMYKCILSHLLTLKNADLYCKNHI